MAVIVRWFRKQRPCLNLKISKPHCSEEIVRKLDSGDLPLASLLEVYEEGVTLSRFCQTKLEEAERKVEILNKKADGTLERRPFEEQDSE